MSAVKITRCRNCGHAIERVATFVPYWRHRWGTLGAVYCAGRRDAQGGAAYRAATARPHVVPGAAGEVAQ